MKKEFRSGFVSLVGRPNVGKSTLMNRLVGEKVAIISPKPQTTRNQIKSILTTEDMQAVFIDTPGIHTARHKLGDYMVRAAETTLNQVDLVLMLCEPTNRPLAGDKLVLERLQKTKTPVVLVMNKLDTVDKAHLLPALEAFRDLYPFREIVPVSALKGDNTDELLRVIGSYLPQGPQYFPADMVTDQPERQLAAEIIREKALQLLAEEVPHGVAVEITRMRPRETGKIIDVEATIFCERDSHKGIIIGKNGEMLKEIGKRARKDLEGLLGSQVYLNLWVKVKKNWRDSDFLLRNFGYSGDTL